jgi:hypothetical protein
MIPKTNVEQTKDNMKGIIFYLYIIKDLIEGKNISKYFNIIQDV